MSLFHEIHGKLKWQNDSMKHRHTYVYEIVPVRHSSIFIFPKQKRKKNEYSKASGIACDSSYFVLFVIFISANQYDWTRHVSYIQM